MKALNLSLLCLCAGLCGVTGAADYRVSASEQKDLSLTIYQNNMALVRDQRDVSLQAGKVALQFKNVSPQIRAQTAILRSLTSPDSMQVSGLYYDNRLLTPATLLESYVGKTVTVMTPNPKTGMEKQETATVLAAGASGVVLKIGDRIETNVPGRLVFNKVPGNLLTAPVLTVLLNNKQASTQRLELVYLTDGLNWRTDYVARLNNRENRMDLSAWVTLNNHSGTDFKQAKLQLIAGQVNQSNAPRYLMAKAAPGAMLEQSSADQISGESFSDLQLYTIPGKNSIANGQTRQIALFTVRDVPVKKELVLYGNQGFYQARYNDAMQKMPIQMEIEFKNDKASHLGKAFPKGALRFYREDTQKRLQFIGEDALNHTPVGETVRARLGTAFDVTAERTQSSFKQLPETAGYRRQYQSAFEIVLRNAKKEAVHVMVREPLPYDWEILSESQGHKQEGRQAVWNVRVPAEGEATLKYEVLVKMP